MPTFGPGRVGSGLVDESLETDCVPIDHPRDTAFPVGGAPTGRITRQRRSIIISPVEDFPACIDAVSLAGGDWTSGFINSVIDSVFPSYVSNRAICALTIMPPALQISAPRIADEIITQLLRGFGIGNNTESAGARSMCSPRPTPLLVNPSFPQL